MGSNEIKNLLFFSLVRGKFLPLGIFLGEKILQRWQFGKTAYGWPYYSTELKKLVRSCLGEKIHPEWQLPITQSATPQTRKNQTGAPTEIQLASTILKTMDGDIPFQNTFSDPEDEESLRRWNWLLTTLSQTDV